MLTEIKPDGTWSVKGIDFKECTSEMYGALCKLRDYERSGFEPDDLDLVKENVHIGSNIQNYIVFGIWNDCCIAENLNASEQYVVWTIEKNGFGVRAGHYFGNIQQAQKYFYHAAIGSTPNTKEYWKR